MVSRSLVLGYHGCDLAVADDVVAGRTQLRASENGHDWLGGGRYFWEDSYSRALRWAQVEKAQNSSKVKTPCVLGAIIDLGDCLNLIDAEDLELVKTAHLAYLEFCAISGVNPAQNKGRDLKARFLDKAVFETLHKLGEQEKKPPFETVRAFFIEGEPLYETAGLHSLDHIQICVRESRNILGYFLPRQS
jgi:hypothetical protein